MATITSTEAGATGRYIDLGSPTSQDDLTAQTIIAYLKPASNSVIGYVWAKGDSSGNGPRMIINTAQNVAVGFGSSGVVNAPSMIANTTTITFGTWQHWQATHDGTVNASGINFYLDAASASTPGSPTNGSGTFGTDASYNEFLMNRTGLGREYVGDVAYIARWNRVLDSTARQNVRDNGPLSEPSGLVLCWANDQDYSSNAITASARSTRVTGSTPTNTALGGVTTISATVGDAVAAGIAATVSSAVTISATPGNAVAAGTTATITTVSMAFEYAYERASFNPTGSSVSGSGDSAIISINPKVQESEVISSLTAWLEPSVDVTGLNGFRPTFRFLAYKSGDGGIVSYASNSWQSTREPMFSYDDGLTWNYFDTAVTRDTGNEWIEFRHSTAFTQDKVRIGRSRQFTLHQTGDWIAAQATAHPSFFVPSATALAYTPSGSVSTYAAQTFIADEYSTQTDSLGATVPVTPLYAFEINDTSLTPAGGGSKRLAVITAGVHAGEDHGAVVFMRFVEYLCGSSTEAQYLRQEYRIVGYPCINAPGRVSGAWRGSWTQGVGGADDANRHFNSLSSGLEIVDKPRAAMATDQAGAWPDWMIDFHGTWGMAWSFVQDAADTWHTRFMTLITSYSGETVLDNDNTISTTVAAYFKAGGTKLAVTNEVGDPVPVSDAELTSYGTAMVQTVSAMVAEGQFFIPAQPGNAVAAGVTATITATSATVISATPGAAAADGAMASVIRTITASPGDAVANGSIAAILRIIAASPGGAVANGATATITGAGPVTETIARPISDTSNTGWTPSTGVDLYPMVDEVTPDALDYISTTTLGSICKMALNTTAYPGTASQQLKFQASSSLGNSVIVRLKDGATTIRTETQVLTATDTIYTITLTSGEIASITSGSLSVELESA